MFCVTSALNFRIFFLSWTFWIGPAILSLITRIQGKNFGRFGKICFVLLLHSTFEILKRITLALLLLNYPPKIFLDKTKYICRLMLQKNSLGASQNPQRRIFVHENKYWTNRYKTTISAA